MHLNIAVIWTLLSAYLTPCLQGVSRQTVSLSRGLYLTRELDHCQRLTPDFGRSHPMSDWAKTGRARRLCIVTTCLLRLMLSLTACLTIFGDCWGLLLPVRSHPMPDWAFQGWAESFSYIYKGRLFYFTTNDLHA